MFDASMKMIFEKKYWKWKLIPNYYKIIGLVCSFVLKIVRFNFKIALLIFEFTEYS